MERAELDAFQARIGSAARARWGEDVRAVRWQDARGHFVAAVQRTGAIELASAEAATREDALAALAVKVTEVTT